LKGIKLINFDCVSIGDSIATREGLGGSLHCQEIHAVYGKPSSFIIHEAAASGPHYACVISAGSNDPLNLNLEKNLEAIRRNVHCQITIWVKPAHSRPSSVVGHVAALYGDRAVQVYPGRDGVHPKSYPALAQQIRNSI
jgi:hypothetical protein